MQIDPFAAPLSAAASSPTTASALLLALCAALAVIAGLAGKERRAVVRAEHRRRVRGLVARRFAMPAA